MQFKSKCSYIVLTCALLFWGFVLLINVHARPPKQPPIVFQSNRDNKAEIYIMDADGKNKINLTNNQTWDGYPFWSSDGQRIAFTSNRDGNHEVYVMDADGKNKINLTNNQAWDGFSSWSPERRKARTLVVRLVNSCRVASVPDRW